MRNAATTLSDEDISALAAFSPKSGPPPQLEHARHVKPSPNPAGKSDAKKVLGVLLALAAIVVVAGGLVSFFSREEATVPIEQTYGPNPTLAEPNPTLLPTINVAEGTPWPEGTMPTAAQGFAVIEFAARLDHPRWLQVLPNGDVLVAESNAPPKPDGTSADAHRT